MLLVNTKKRGIKRITLKRLIKLQIQEFNFSKILKKTDKEILIIYKL